MRPFPALGKFDRPPFEFDPAGRGKGCERIAGPPFRGTSTPRLGIDMLPAFGRSTLPPLGRATPDRWPFSIPGRIPPPFIPPALGGRGTERPHMPAPLLGDTDPRPGFIGVVERWLLIGPFGRCAPPFQFGREPIPYPAFALVPRPVGAVARLIVGREKLRGGGAAALIPPFAPSLDVMVGFMSNE